MNRRNVIKSGALSAAVAAAAPLASAAPADLEAISKHWAAAKDFTLKVADAMPGDDYTFKPMPAMRSYGELMAHLAGNNAFYISRFNHGEIPDNLRPLKQFDKDTVKKYMSDSFDFCANLLSKLTDADLDKSYPGRPNQPPATGWDWVFNAFIHTAHHRGYADVYLRLKNIVPPRYSV